MSNLKIKNLTEFRADFQRLLIDCIDREYIADVAEDGSPCEQIESVAAVLAEEIRRSGYYSPRKCSEWLRGLPSALTVPFSNAEVILWFYDIGALSGADNRDQAIELYAKACNDGDQAVENLPDLYWEKLGSVLYSLINNNPALSMIDQVAHDARSWAVMVSYSDAVKLDAPPVPVMIHAENRDQAIENAPRRLAGLYPDLGSPRAFTVKSCERVHAADLETVNRIAL